MTRAPRPASPRSASPRRPTPARLRTPGCPPGLARLAAGAAGPAGSGGLGPHGRTSAPAPHSLVVLLCHRARSPLPGRRTGLSGWDSTPDPGGGGGGGGGGESGAAAPTGWVRFSRSEPAPRGLRALGTGLGSPLAGGATARGGASGPGGQRRHLIGRCARRRGGDLLLRVVASSQRARRSWPRAWGRAPASPPRASDRVLLGPAVAALSRPPAGRAVLWRRLPGLRKFFLPRPPTQVLRCSRNGVSPPGGRISRAPGCPPLGCLGQLPAWGL